MLAGVRSFGSSISTFCWGTSPTNNPTDLERKIKQERISSFALLVIGLIVAISGIAFMGVGTHQATMTIGYGIIPYLFGAHLGMIGLMICLVASGFACKGVWHTANFLGQKVPNGSA